MVIRHTASVDKLETIYIKYFTLIIFFVLFDPKYKFIHRVWLSSIALHRKHNWYIGNETELKDQCEFSIGTAERWQT